MLWNILLYVHTHLIRLLLLLPFHSRLMTSLSHDVTASFSQSTRSLSLHTPIKSTMFTTRSRGGNNHSPTRQMRVEFGMGEYFFKLTRQLGECFFLLSVSLFSPLFESYSSPIPKYKHTPDAVIYLLLWQTHGHDNLFFRVGLVQTQCTLYKCSAKTWFWRVFLWFGE
jgi:hypothetical protein